MLIAIFVVAFLWYVTQQVKFAPKADPRRAWRTLTIWFGRMSFDDKTLYDNVRYARHAISIVENRASFARVGWGDPKSTRPNKDAEGIECFQQIWFAGNHSDIGGSYAENESRLSDTTLSWMISAAESIIGGIKIDNSILHRHSSSNGMQHDERKAGFPLLTRFLGLTWPDGRREVQSDARLHETVYQRFALPGVLQYDSVRLYRPEGLRRHEGLAEYYKDIPLPAQSGGLWGFIRRYFLLPGQ